MLIRREDVAAVAVDYQERLMPVMQEKEALLAHSVILLRGLKELGVPIYLTQQYTRGLGMTVPEIVEAAGTREYLVKNQLQCGGRSDSEAGWEEVSDSLRN